MKILTIIKNDYVTGVEYGMKEIHVTDEKAKDFYNKVQQKFAQIHSKRHINTKHK